ncbi:MAG: hypothetical protein U1E06_14910 [Tabrizicola sp.]|nr:hypothetical protein [Tabrizicola sp.]
MRAGDEVAQTADPFAALTNLSPDLAASMFAFGKMPYEKSRLSLREFEAARIRTAEINGCMICQGFRAARDLPDLLGIPAEAQHPELLDRGPAPDEAFYRDILDWRGSAIYSARERIAIELAERMGLDPAPLPHDSDFWGKARSVFGEEEIADLVISIGAWIAGGRTLHVLGLDMVCAAPVSVGP